MAMCEIDKPDMATSIVVAANRLAEARKTDPGSAEHVSVMKDLLNQLHRPGALDALTKIMPNGSRKP